MKWNVQLSRNFVRPGSITIEANSAAEAIAITTAMIQKGELDVSSRVIQWEPPVASDDLQVVEAWEPMPWNQ